MNFGTSVAEQAALGQDSSLSYTEVQSAGSRGWDYVMSVAQEDAEFWGPMNPDLNAKSNWNGKETLDKNEGCPWYYTPQQHWPKELRESYLGDKRVFGILRDPFDRWTAFLRSSEGPTGRGFEYVSDNSTCRDKFNRLTKLMMKTEADWDTNTRCQLQLQAPFFEGNGAISLAQDLVYFPSNTQELLDTHGYDNVHLDAFKMMHVTACDQFWHAEDFDADSRKLIEEYYARDFKLIRKTLDRDDTAESHCCMGVPGMCPSKKFTWHNNTVPPGYTERLASVAA
jgi:hypothetical protein